MSREHRPPLIVSPKMIARIEAFHLQFGIARMNALSAIPENPYGITVQHFGALTALKTTSALLRGKNRVANVTEEGIAYLEAALGFYRTNDLIPSLYVPYGKMTPTLFLHLTQAGFWSGGSATVPIGIPGECALPEHPSLIIRALPLTEKELYLDVFQAAFGERGESARDYRAFQWAEDTLTGAVRYVAEWDGIPVGIASLICQDGMGYFGTAGVLPSHRGRGIQAALIARRLTDAPALGVDLIIGGGSVDTTTHRNFERAGLRLVPLGVGWAQRP